MFCNLERTWYKRVIGVWSQVDPGSKVQEQFLPKKKTRRELWPICQALLALKFREWKLVLDFVLYRAASAMFTRAQGVKNIPDMHSDHVLLLNVNFISTK